jgi:hypothetical protein
VALADAVFPELKVDSQFSRSEILGLVRVLLGMNAGELAAATLPVVAAGAAVDLQLPEADAALAPFRGRTPAPTAPSATATTAPASNPDC